MDHSGAIKHILDRLDKELPEHFTYHGAHHTLDVMDAVERIAQPHELSTSKMNLLLVAAAYHDCGFIYGHENHEETGCKVAKAILPKYGFDKRSIVQICEMIMATKVPQNPGSVLSNILCDADLDYLGRDDFKPIADSLFKELHHLNIVSNIETWNRIQLAFLTRHEYHTDYSRKVRQPMKEQYVRELATIVEQYED